MPSGYPSPYTGQQVDSAVAAVLALPSSGAIIDAVALGGYVTASGAAIIASSAVILPLVTTSASVISSSVLSGGTSYIYDSATPVTSIWFDAITLDCRAQFKFTAGATVTMGFPAGCAFAGESAPASGSSYILAINQHDIVCVPYTETV